MDTLKLAFGLFLSVLVIALLFRFLGNIIEFIQKFFAKLKAARRLKLGRK